MWASSSAEPASSATSSRGGSSPPATRSRSSTAGRSPTRSASRVERLRGDRTTADFERLLAGRSFDAAVDFAAYDGTDGRRAAEVLGGRVGHYVAISTGQVYLVREGCPRPARESDYDGPLMPEPADAFDKGQWDYGIEEARARGRARGGLVDERASRPRACASRW